MKWRYFELFILAKFKFVMCVMLIVDNMSALIDHIIYGRILGLYTGCHVFTNDIRKLPP